MKWYVNLGAAALLTWTAGCVPLSEYRALEERFEGQQEYVDDHKERVRELERREQVMTLRLRESERQLELTRARLEKSERLRQRLQDRVGQTVPASAPREEPQTVAGLEVNPATSGLVMESGLLFPAGKAELKAEGRQLLDRLIAELNGPEFATYKVRIDGHTDATPIRHSKDRHSSNWDLSAKRALAVVHYMQESGVDPDRLSFAGFGPHRPLADGDDRAARAKNRRVEVVLFEE